MLEISKPDMPCDTIAGAFSDGRSGRISILTHPLDSRMYARVLAEGEVRPGDAIRLLPPAADSQAELHDLLDRIEAVARAFNVSLWQATADAGFDVRLVDDGELAMVASPQLPGRTFNRVSGHRELPNLLPRMVDWFFDQRDVRLDRRERGAVARRRVGAPIGDPRGRAVGDPRGGRRPSARRACPTV